MQDLSRSARLSENRSPSRRRQRSWRFLRANRIQVFETLGICPFVLSLSKHSYASFHTVCRSSIDKYGHSFFVPRAEVGLNLQGRLERNDGQEVLLQGSDSELVGHLDQLGH